MPGDVHRGRCYPLTWIIPAFKQAPLDPIIGGDLDSGIGNGSNGLGPSRRLDLGLPDDSVFAFDRYVRRGTPSLLPRPGRVAEKRLFDAEEMALGEQLLQAERWRSLISV